MELLTITTIFTPSFKAFELEFPSKEWLTMMYVFKHQTNMKENSRGNWSKNIRKGLTIARLLKFTPLNRIINIIVNVNRI